MHTVHPVALISIEVATDIAKCLLYCSGKVILCTYD